MTSAARVRVRLSLLVMSAAATVAAPGLLLSADLRPGYRPAARTPP